MEQSHFQEEQNAPFPQKIPAILLLYTMYEFVITESPRMTINNKDILWLLSHL